MNRPTFRQTRLIAGCIVGLTSGFGGLFIGSLALFMKPIAADFGWSRADISAAVVMSMLGLGIGSPIQGWLLDRVGRRAVIGGSILSFAAALMLLSTLPANHLLFALNCLAIGAVATATGPNGYLALLPPWFDRRLGLALACAMIGVGIGPALLAPLAESLIRANGWRVAYRDLAGIALVGGVIAMILISVGPPPRTIATGNPGGEGLSFAEGLRDPRMRLLMLVLAMGGACGLGITFHTAAMLDDRGFAPGQIATTVGLSGVGLIVGRVGGGPLLDEFPARIVGACAYLLGALAVAVLALDLTRSFPIVAAGGMMLGLALGTEGDFAAFTVRRYFGARAFGGLYGCAFMAYAVGSVVGVILCGYAYDRTGNYFAVGVASLLGFVVAAALMLRLGPYSYAAKRPEAPSGRLAGEAV